MDPRLSHITHVFLDADDTLWENDIYYRKAEAEFVELMSRFVSSQDAAKILVYHQELNIKIFGYGSKTLLLGMLDAACQIVPEKFNPACYKEIKEIIVRLEQHRFDFLEGAEETVRKLAQKYTVIIATKGEMSEQLRKWRISKLQDCVTAIEVMEKKSVDDYLNLAAKVGVKPSDFFMVGNAVRSDVAPVIELGGWAVHVPYKFTWAHEVMDLPKSEKVFEISKISQLCDILL